jgi:hypothetical protein
MELYIQTPCYISRRSDLNLQLILVSRNPFLKSMNYKKFKGLKDIEGSAEDMVCLT